ncbi:sigma-E factor negative regulatory protein [uncultured Massilia sp.]|uniref:sigma-E factor negative regulatory protein n=1 Tax=uncultured Massilia sp. TaxID=169973 RepID=UPI0025FC8490|nr:sigma-E factor negative regulatory protein [uncultured Massilia sp.]
MEPMDTNKKNRELISALMDDALPAADVELALAALGTPAGEQAWATFHRIGDVLRAGGAPELSPAFGARLAAQLAAEPPPTRRAGAEAAQPAPAAAATEPR